MLSLLLLGTCLLALATGQIVIVNEPTDARLCTGDTANVPCGFTGANPNVVVPNWRIVKTNNGMVVSDMHVASNFINTNTTNDLHWLPDLTSGVNNAPNSKLLVGPVDGSYDQISLQCLFTTSTGVVTSRLGTLSIGSSRPAISDVQFPVVQSTQFTVSWSVSSETCGSVVYTVHVISSDGTLLLINTTQQSHQFKNLKLDFVYTVTVLGSNSIGEGDTVTTTVRTMNTTVIGPTTPSSGVNTESASTAMSTDVPSPTIIQPTATAGGTGAIEDDDDTLSGSIIVVIVVCIVLFLLLVLAVIAILVCAVMRQKRKATCSKSGFQALSSSVLNYKDSPNMQTESNNDKTTTDKNDDPESEKTETDSANDTAEPKSSSYVISLTLVDKKPTSNTSKDNQPIQIHYADLDLTTSSSMVQSSDKQQSNSYTEVILTTPTSTES